MASDSLDRIADEVSSCRACPRLVQWREQVASERRSAYRDEEYWGRGVPGFGDPDATLVVMGLAPAAHGANRTGRMFTGDRSGEWLYRALWRAGFANRAESVGRDDGLVLRGAWITAPVRCAPPGNRPTPLERDTCIGFAARELALLEGVRCMVALGGFGFEAASKLLGVTPRPRFGHGVEVEAPNGVVLVGCYHVSQQNTFTGRLTEDMLDAVFGRARELCGVDRPN